MADAPFAPPFVLHVLLSQIKHIVQLDCNLRHLNYLPDSLNAEKISIEWPTIRGRASHGLRVRPGLSALDVFALVSVLTGYGDSETTTAVRVRISQPSVMADGDADENDRDPLVAANRELSLRRELPQVLPLLRLAWAQLQEAPESLAGLPPVTA